MNVDILPVPKPPENTRSTRIKEPLPTMHSLFVGKTGSGKTNLIVNLITRNVFGYNKHYDKIIVISPTLGYDNSWELVADVQPKKGRVAYELIDCGDDANTELENLLNEAMEDPETKRLCILDDCLSLLHNSAILSTLFTTARHYKLHL